MTALFIATASLYAISCALYLWLLAPGSTTRERAAQVTLLGAAVSHVAFLVVDYAVNGRIPFGDIHQTLSAASLLLVASYLATLIRYRMSVLGAFITPITLLFFLGAGLGRSVAHVPADVRSALLPLHIGANILGIVAFSLAAAAALAYVIQERLLRRKRLSGLFQRLPPLDVLDTFGLRSVTIGFPLLTIGIVTGTIWAVRLDPGLPMISTAQAFAVLAWLVFAGVLALRVAAGWRGRRAAVGTMLGFGCAMAVLLAYFFRSAGGAG